MKNLLAPELEAALAPNDSELVARLQDRDPAALAELLALHGNRLYAVAFQITRNETDAGEVVQDSLLAIWNKIDQFEGRSALTTWLHRLTANAALMKLRKQKRFRDHVPLDVTGAAPADDEPALTLPDPGAAPDRRLVRAELRDRVHAAIEALPEPYRTTVVLADVDELSMEEIAAATNVSVPAVKSRLHRGRLSLRKALTPYLSRSL